MRPALFFLLLICLLPLGPAAQAPHYGQHLRYAPDAGSRESDFDRKRDLRTAPPLPQTNDHFMRRTVYGFHPGWGGSSYKVYDYGILPTIAYYGYVVDPGTGGYKTLYQWKSSPIVRMAHESGSAVDLVAATGSARDNRLLLSQPSNINTLVDSLLHLIILRDADGVCFDFEDLPADQGPAFTALVQQMRDSLDQQRRKAGISITLPCTDPSGAYDLAALRGLADRFILKPYTESPSADTTFEAGLFALAEQSLIHYQRRGLPKQQTVLGIPLYGSHPAQADFLSYRQHRLLADSLRSQSRILEVDDLGAFLDLATNRNLQGVSLWALGYDHGFDEVHDLVKAKYSQSETVGSGTRATADKKGLLGSDDGATRERNANNWMWMLGGCVVFLILLFIIKRIT